MERKPCVNILYPSDILPKNFSNESIYNKISNVIFQYNDDWKNIISENFDFDNNNELIKNFKQIKNLIYGVSKGTEPLKCYASKISGESRIFSIPNPIVQIPLHIYILKNQANILGKQSEDSEKFISSSRYYYDNEEVYSSLPYGDFEIDSMENIVVEPYKSSLMSKYKISDGKYYRMKIDISNFFNNIYTHMISWIASTERERVLLGNLDVLMRNTNFGETKGILTGPYTSGLFSELLLSKVDNKIKQYISENSDASFVRFVDDFEFYSDSKEILENETKYRIEKELMDIKLEINYSKLSFTEFPFLELESNIKQEISLIINNRDNEFETMSIVEEIISLINSGLKISVSRCAYIIKLLISEFKLNNMNIEANTDDDAIVFLIDYLINLMFKYNFLTNHICNLILIIIEKNSISKDKFIEKLLNKKDKRKAHCREIIDIWIVHLISYLNICNEEVINYYKDIIYQSDLSAVIILNQIVTNGTINTHKVWLKKYFNNIKKELKTNYGDNWKLASWMSKYWLILYNNEQKWKIHKINGFRDCLFADVNIESLMVNDVIKTRINLFKVMLDNKIEFFTDY